MHRKGACVMSKDGLMRESPTGTQVKRCNEMSRRLRFFHEQVSDSSLAMAPAMVDTGFDLDELEVRCT